jgi:hypothetical protein
MVHDVDVCWSELKAERQDLGERVSFFWRMEEGGLRGREGDAPREH